MIFRSSTFFNISRAIKITVAVTEAEEIAIDAALIT